MPDREKVLKGLECCQYSYKPYCDGCPYAYEGLTGILDCTADLACDVLELLKEQEHAWISVKDRLPPKDDKKVLTYGDPVTHWMPLPEPPEVT